MKKGAEEGGDARLKCVDGYTDLANAIIVQACAGSVYTV